MLLTKIDGLGQNNVYEGLWAAHNVSRYAYITLTSRSYYAHHTLTFGWSLTNALKMDRWMDKVNRTFMASVSRYAHITRILRSHYAHFQIIAP